jgi:hypothetical protein
MVDLVLVQADGLHQVHLDLVAGGNAADQVSAGGAGVLCDGQQRRNVVAGVGVFGGEEGVMVIQLAHRHAVGPGGPFRRGPVLDAEHGGALAMG